VRLDTVIALTYNFLPYRDKDVQPANTPSPKRHCRFSLVTHGRSIHFEAQNRDVFIIYFIAVALTRGPIYKGPSTTWLQKLRKQHLLVL